MLTFFNMLHQYTSSKLKNNKTK